MGKSADLKLKVTSDTSQATTGLGGLKNKMSDLGNNQGLTSFNKGLLAVAPAAAAVGLAVSKIVSATKEWVDLYTIQEQAETKLQATLSATGNQIGMTVDELGDYASSLQKTTTYGDETILGVEQLMVATKSLSKEGLQRATIDALDLATAMGTSVTSAGQQLARALTDPIGQLTTLKRMNINFTDSEKDKIKTLMETNRVEDAQNIILSKVESTYGGIAESVGALDSSKLTQISNVVGDIKEDLGEGLVLSLAPAFEWLLDSLYKVENYIQAINGTTSGIASYTSIVKWQKNGMDPTEAPDIRSTNWEGARASAYSSILDTYDINNLGKGDDRINSNVSNKISEARENGDSAGAVDLIKKALGNDIYTKSSWYSSIQDYREEFMALQTIDEYEQNVPTKPTISNFSSASSGAQQTNATSESEVQTVTDFISSNKTASDSAQKQYYKELIDKANEYKTTATATEGEKTSLDEMITTWNEKKEAIGKTTEEVSIYGEFVKSNSALSVSAQEEDIQAQINKATALSNNNALSEKQKTILDEIIIKLKEQKAVLEAPVENAIDNYIKENRTYSNTAVVDAISEQVKYAESLLESSDLTDTQRQKLTEILAALKAIKEEASNPDSNNDIISDDTNEIISSSLNLLQTSTNLIDQLFTNSINTKKEQLEELQNAFKLTSDSAKESAISQISSLDKQYGEGLISLSDYEAKVKSVYATKNATIAEAAEAEESKQKEIDKLKERQFNVDKANNLLQALANGALGITDIWSKHGANPVLAGVLTGIETAAISASFATIASQKYTSLATGGFVSGSTHVEIGEGGDDEIVLPLNQDVFDKYGLSSKSSNNGTGVINFNISISGGSDSNNTTKAVYNAIEKAQRTGYIPRWNYAK
jgi:hypothetical protein